MATLDSGLQGSINICHSEGTEKDIVLNEIIATAQMRERGEAPTRRPCIMVLPGGLVGINGGSGMAALESLKLSRGFHAMLGCSTGAAAVAYGDSGKANIGNTIYANECCTEQFFNLKRRKLGLPIMGVHWLVHTVFTGKHPGSEHKRLDTAKLIASPVETYFAVRDVATKETELLRPQDETHALELLEASMSFPALTNNKPVQVGNRLYQDAGDADPFPFSAFVKAAQPTSLLVFANRAASDDRSPEFTRQLGILTSSGMPHVIIWTDKMNRLINTADALKLAGEHFRTTVETLFGVRKA